MKPFITGILFLILILGLWYGAWCYEELRAESDILHNHVQRVQRDIRALQQDKIWRIHHTQEIADSLEKGWIQPTPRLLVADWLDSLLASHENATYRLEPETVLSLTPDLMVKATPVSIELITPSDTEIYEIYEKLLDEFPGLILPKEVLMTHKGEDQIEGVLVFIWCAYYDL